MHAQMLASIHVRVHTLSHEPNPAPSLTHSPPLVFDVVFGEPCLKKFFSGFEVALFPHSLSAASSFIFWQFVSLGGKQAGMEQDARPTYAVYHVLYLWTWEASRSYCFLWDMSIPPSTSCQNTVVALVEELFFKTNAWGEKSFDVIPAIYQTWF